MFSRPLRNETDTFQDLDTERTFALVSKHARQVRFPTHKHVLLAQLAQLYEGDVTQLDAVGVFVDLPLFDPVFDSTLRHRKIFMKMSVN